MIYSMFYTSLVAAFAQGVLVSSSFNFFESFLQYCLIVVFTAYTSTPVTCLGRFFKHLVLNLSISFMYSYDSLKKKIKN